MAGVQARGREPGESILRIQTGHGDGGEAGLTEMELAGRTGEAGRVSRKSRPDVASR